MQTPHAYRRLAEICIRQAEHAASPEHRVTLLSKAQALLRKADQAEAMDQRASATTASIGTVK